MEKISHSRRAKMAVANELKKYLIEWFDYRFKVVEITILFDKMTISHKDKLLTDKVEQIKQMAKSENAKPYAIETLNQMKFVMQFQHLKIFRNIIYMFDEAGIDTVQLNIGYEDFHTFSVPKPKEQKES
ncbi:hypothetical protein [Pedobacter puniceum]|uniref:Uncharacterized protein n=1 Tax=Pedobacter puniceum TaxID=2666136 RepID=A0A7K0FL08_9SPHI|nr:hypothetical protein [Pedobacter puniceum]MRX46638.1 hypothetical protein [Pedobacter puniceum]